jgi:hypothetical protein
MQTKLSAVGNLKVFIISFSRIKQPLCERMGRAFVIINEELAELFWAMRCAL